MNICIISTYDCTYDEFRTNVEAESSVWGQYVDD